MKKDYEKFVKEFYSEGYYEGDPTRSAYADYEHDKPLIVANMRKFLSFFNGDHTHRKLLDVGCAFGYFVELALSQGYDAYGLDPSSFAVGKAKELVGKSRIIEGTIEHTTYPKASFDVITLFDVFEHLQDPLADMKKLATVLKSDGVIIIATGDTKSLAAQVMKRRWTFFIPPQHVFFFHRKNVTTLLHKAGLRPIKWHRVGKWLSLGYILHLARTTGESKLADWLYTFIRKTPLMRFPLYIPMKDNMVLLAKKL
ncbi:MAG TPA: class I SAM-dependent methyltransferase [Patescibacteria group bacterium]|nr:class I SAM-dependent methyltransferase [Patescibacteria group bacterium]